MMGTATDILRSHGQAVEAALAALPGALAGTPHTLADAMQYSLLAGGKRLRPALVLECFNACAGSEETRGHALAAAVAIEMVHTFSLVHDDLPAMDDDDLRRGRPTNHKVYGEAVAILAGDALVAEAFALLAHSGGPHAARLVFELASATGAAGMIGGQTLDIESEGTALSLDALQTLHAMKTGALLRCACRMGGITSVCSEEALAALTKYGQHLGLAFQITVDLLDVTATAEQMGKATGKDSAKGKNTYPRILGVKGAKAAADGEVVAACDAAAALGPQAGGLVSLARMVGERQT